MRKHPLLLNPRLRLVLAGVPLVLLLTPSILRGDWGFVALCLAIWVPIGIIAFAVRLKFALLRVTQPAAPRLTTLEEWPQLNRTAWDEVARGWQELGFEPRTTWVTGEAAPQFGVSVSQLWESAAKDALVQVSQTVLPRPALVVNSFVFSFWGDAALLQEQARALEMPAPAPIASPLAAVAPAPAAPASERVPVTSYGTHNRARSGFLHLQIHPQVMGTRLTGAPPEELWQTHLARRGAISQALQQAPLAGDLAALVLDHSRVLTALWHRRFSRNFALHLVRALRRSPSQNEFWGELDAKIRGKARDVSA